MGAYISEDDFIIDSFFDVSPVWATESANCESLAKRVIKVRPPFPVLPSYPVTATILAYLNWTDRSKQLLNLLSKQSALYRTQHAPILNSFMVKFDPPMIELDFG